MDGDSTRLGEKKFSSLQRTFHSTKYSGLKFRVFHGTNGTVFSSSLDKPLPGHQVPSFAQKYEIKRKTLLPLFTCFVVARRR